MTETPSKIDVNNLANKAANLLKEHGLSNDEIKSQIQSFVEEVNNISLNLSFPIFNDPMPNKEYKAILNQISKDSQNLAENLNKIIGIDELFLLAESNHPAPSSKKNFIEELKGLACITKEELNKKRTLGRKGNIKEREIVQSIAEIVFNYTDKYPKLTHDRVLEEYKGPFLDLILALVPDGYSLHQENEGKYKWIHRALKSKEKDYNEGT